MSDAGSAPITRLLYLHGFRSSPQSTKARRVAAWVAAHRPDVEFCCPQLPASPRAAMAMIDASADASADPAPCDALAVIGSSLGGYYATALAERCGCRCVLLNPAVDPARDLATRIGATTAWHDATPFEFRAEYVDELRAIAPPRSLTDLNRYFAVIAKGDEVLSWREMSARYAGCRALLLEGSDHAISDFDAVLPAVVAFLGLTSPSARP